MMHFLPFHLDDLLLGEGLVAILALWAWGVLNMRATARRLRRYALKYERKEK